MITSLIIDDEAPARSYLVRLLSAHADIEVAGEASNGLEALEQIVERRPDVIFLDIEMPGLNGFEVLSQLRAPPITIFATAFDEYAVRAFEANALDYLLKPIQPARLSQTLDKVRTRTNAPREAYDSSLRRAVATVNGRPSAKIVGRRGKRMILLSPREVVYAAIEDQLAFLHTATERFATDRTLSELDELLAPAGFVRVSRAALVNLNYARELLPSTSGTWTIKLANGVELDVSRDRARDLKARLL
jgi:DNA-binding LytR/AlgR family response regulator